MTTREMLRQCADALESCGFDKKSAALRALAARWDAEITLAREMMTDDGQRSRSVDPPRRAPTEGAAMNALNVVLTQ
jgi:hypothetical protein